MQGSILGSMEPRMDAKTGAQLDQQGVRVLRVVGVERIAGGPTRTRIQQRWNEGASIHAAFVRPTPHRVKRTRRCRGGLGSPSPGRHNRATSGVACCHRGPRYEADESFVGVRFAREGIRLRIVLVERQPEEPAGRSLGVTEQEPIMRPLRRRKRGVGPGLIAGADLRLGERSSVDAKLVKCSREPGVGLELGTAQPDVDVVDVG